MNTVLELAGVALAALLSENLVLVSCMGIGTHTESFDRPREAIRTGLCLTVVMMLGALSAWLINYFFLARFRWEHFQVLIFSLLSRLWWPCCADSSGCASQSCPGGWTPIWPPSPPTAPL